MPKPKKPRKPPVPKPRNGGTWTESSYWSAVRSALRRKFAFWNPAMQAKRAARKPYCGPNKRQTWTYQCACCKKWFMEKEVQIDHKVACGSLKCAEDIPGFLSRLTPESADDYQILCKDKCHLAKSLEERRHV